MPAKVVIPRRSITGMSDSGLSRTAARILNGSTRRVVRWTAQEVLEQVVPAGEEAEAVARALLDSAVGHPRIGIKGGKGMIDRSLTMYVDSGRGKGVLSLYAPENGGGPTLELRIEQMCSMPPYDCDEARVQLTADLRTLGIARLDSENILSAVRPNIPLDQLADGCLERLLTVVDRCLE
jgi:hypothetical protein